VRSQTWASLLITFIGMIGTLVVFSLYQNSRKSRPVPMSFWEILGRNTLITLALLTGQGRSQIVKDHFRAVYMFYLTSALHSVNYRILHPAESPTQHPNSDRSLVFGCGRHLQRL
jgi:hypothetical protein